MPLLELTVSGGASLSVRHFAITETISTPFNVSVLAVSREPNINARAIVGRPASFRLASGVAQVLDGKRRWKGVCIHMEQVHALPEGGGLSTYQLTIVPTLWLLSQRRSYRIFQHLNAPDIVKKIVAKWKISPSPAWRINPTRYPKLEYRVQYGETDLAFINRILEEAGISYFFEDDGQGSRLILSDQPQSSRSRGAIWHESEPNESAEKEFVTDVRVADVVRPGAYSVRDFDFRRPNFGLTAEAPKASGREANYVQQQYIPGAFLAETQKGGDTPVADDRGVARHDVNVGARLARRRLQGERAAKRTVRFETNAVDLAPGVVFSIENHPNNALDGKNLLVTELSLEGEPGDDWNMSGTALFAARPYRPALRTPKPSIHGLQSAMVVGPEGQEIFTDEFGRVRVQFHWDRKGKRNERSSCWMRVSQGWAGSGYGMFTVPRVGQEVLVGFLEGDPDQPIVVGRVFNATSPVPYKLPENRTVSTWKSSSTPGGEGFNEIKFEDAAGNELVYVQAQRDLQKLVKANEVETTGASRTITVGANRTATIGGVDSTLVGSKHSVTMAQPSDPPPTIPPTGMAMADTIASLTTGAATVSLNGGNVSIDAAGDISLNAGGSITIAAGSAITNTAVTVTTTAGATISNTAGAEISNTAGAAITSSATRIQITGGGSVKVDSGGTVTVTGSTIEVTAGGPVAIKGSVVDLN
jgi:type VI secretion system secreted protein VgrG